MQKLKTKIRISILGEFSCGKSTLINALLGRDILPHGRSETTMEPREIDYGEHILIDTPGINSTIAGHTEIALRSTDSSDICVFVLSKPEITEVEKEFIDKIDKKIIFVRNFLDEYSDNASGEDVGIKTDNSDGEDDGFKTEKFETDNSDGENNGFETEKFETGNSDGEEDEFKNEKFKTDNSDGENNQFENKIINISALKALSARDESIKRLYMTDTEEISDREKLLSDSNFETFEKSLQHEIETISVLKEIEKLNKKISQGNAQIENIKSKYADRNTLLKYISKTDAKERIRKLRLINKRLIEYKTELEFRYIEIENSKL